MFSFIYNFCIAVYFRSRPAPAAMSNFGAADRQDGDKIQFFQLFQLHIYLRNSDASNGLRTAVRSRVWGAKILLYLWKGLQPTK